MTDLFSQWHHAFHTMSLIAILRGVKPPECIEIARVLYEEGFQIIEVPLNSPAPYESIRQLTIEFPNRVIGAGTVISPEQVKACAESGCKLIVTPGFNPMVADAVKRVGLIYCPGVATPTEAFVALDSGADALKLFPAEMITPDVVRAMRAVLPLKSPLIPVGGITPSRMDSYFAAGANGFGIGSALYRPDKSISDIRTSASKFVRAFQKSRAGW